MRLPHLRLPATLKTAISAINIIIIIIIIIMNENLLLLYCHGQDSKTPTFRTI